MMATDEKKGCVCHRVRCGQEGHLSHACKRNQ